MAERGSYLVSHLGHYAECHTPRDALWAPDANRYLAGAVVDGRLAPNLSSDTLRGIGAWTLGCYAQWTDQLRDAHDKTRCQIDDRFVHAGKHCSLITAYVEGAILSSLDTIRRLDKRENA